MADGKRVLSLCEDVPDRMQKISKLSLDFECFDPLQNAIASMCSQLWRLETIAIPLYTLTPIMLCGLSELPCLREIDFYLASSSARRVYSPDVNEAEKFQPSDVHLSESAFPSLKGLSFCAPHVHIAAEFLHLSTFPLRGLTRLDIRVPNVSLMSGVVVSSLLKGLSISAISLRSLGLNLVGYNGVAAPRMLRVQPLTLHDLLSVANFPLLTRFSIHHTSSLAFSESDFLEFARLVPDMEVLELNPRPAIARLPSVSFTILEYFARFCLKIRSLSVFVRCDGPTERVPFYKFSREFKEVQFGRSPIPRPDDPQVRKSVARYFAEIFPIGITVGHWAHAHDHVDGKQYELADFDRALVQVSGSRVKTMSFRWAGLVAMVNILKEVRIIMNDKEEELRSSALVLRMRLGALAM